MWHWIKRWRDWATTEFWPMNRLTPRSQALRFSYEKAGLVVNDQPVPWNAEAVLVEALLRLPGNATRQKTDFHLRLAGEEMISAEQLRRQESGEGWRAWFRLPPPGRAVDVELIYREHVLGQVNIPFLPRADFLAGLRLLMPTLFVRLGNESVACQTFVANQCRGLVASALLASQTSLAPLLDLDLQVVFRCERSESSWAVPVTLCGPQLAGKQALLTVTPPRHPRRLGAWTATWMLHEQPLATQRVRGISQRHFERSLRISDTRFVVQREGGPVFLTRQVPPLADSRRIGPCFLVSSGEPGMAGQCRLQVAAQVPGAVRNPLLLEQDTLVTDGRVMVAPGTLDAADLTEVAGFDLSVRGRSLGFLSLSPAPTAAFTPEGGFKPPPEFNWSPAAEEEMLERLNRLMDGRRTGH
jgi:hypothetical protein